MNNWRYKLFQFMQGRYGMDAFGKFLLIASLVLVLVSNARYLHILYLPGILLLAYTYFRLMSRNIFKRQQENQKYLALRQRFSRNRSRAPGGAFQGKSSGSRWRRNTEPAGDGFAGASENLQYNFYRCRSCGQTVRVPKGKGTLKITCPNCGNSFIDRT